MYRCLIYIAFSFALGGCIDWSEINPLRQAKPTIEPLGGNGDSQTAKNCVGAFPNSSTGTFDIKTNFPFAPDCSYIFQYPDRDVAIGVLETLGREQIIWFRFKKGLPKDGKTPIINGFTKDDSVSASVDHAELNLHKEYPMGDPVSGFVAVKRMDKDLQVELKLTSTIKMKNDKYLKMTGTITVPNTIEFDQQLSH